MKKSGQWKSRLTYIIFYSMMRTLALLPLRVLYLLAEVLAFLAHDVVCYRRRVVAENLSSSFPEKGEAEIASLSKGFYRWLADYFVETAKLSGMSREEILRRMTFEGIGEINDEFAAGRSVILYLGHYCNWEWISSLPLHFPKDVESCQIYHALENEGADKAFLKLRGRFGSRNVRMEDTFRVLYTLHREGKRSVTGFIADQAPGIDNIHLWIDFLNHDTPVFTGGERMARKLHASAFYCDVSRPRRGYYHCRMIKLADDSSSLEEFDLTRRYFAHLEETIRRQPEFWLWSHRRWKRTRKDFLARYGSKGEARLRHISKVKD
ncbi:MAG: lysophospholipid acyltransferase family protein [Muribaculaceae bacterium]|nr:lysophospholipid acyltransferase family protein [Muribaculaceae bacterium]